MQKITPIIKKTRTNIEKYEVCPHCQEEIREKSIYVDEENYVYHSACRDKGPIDKIKPLSPEEFQNLFGKGQTIKTAEDIENKENNKLEKKLEANLKILIRK